MVQRHSAQRRYTLAEYAIQQHQLRREKLKTRMREQKLEALKQELTKNGTQVSEEASLLTVDDIPEDGLDVSGCNVDGGSFLYPYPSKRRHAILKAAGVKKIDKDEKRELRELRVSREDCGCSCQGFCEPETCSCSLAGIKCQMDHSSFPCGCTKDSCGNREGRVEFNPSRVQTHYIHTIMKLELEKRLEEHAAEGDAPAAEQCQNDAADLSPQGGAPEFHTAGFHFNSELPAEGDDSCSSDTTDSSRSSASSAAQSECLDAGEKAQRHAPPLHAGESGPARIANFGAERMATWPVGYGIFSGVEPAFDDGTGANAPNASRAAAVSELLDENANQDGSLFHGESVPNTPSPSVDRSASFLDLSLSSESDLEFFDGFPCLGPTAIKDYDHLDALFQTQTPGYPSLPQANDPGTCLLESLIGLSESIPEPPATFTDNQMLEEAIKVSVMEYVKV
ncbi:cysteine/serine-rich nuclear protein 1b isoform X2 [Brachyhypopomus gauderio]